MKIQEIKAAYQALDPDDEPMLQQFIHTYGTDARSGVQTLVEQTKKKMVQLEAEYVRSEKMLAFERKYHAMGSRYICGIDEVGRCDWISEERLCIRMKLFCAVLQSTRRSII